MSQAMIEKMNEVTYNNEENGTWGFYGSDRDDFETQKDAFDAYNEQRQGK